MAQAKAPILQELSIASSKADDNGSAETVAYLNNGRQLLLSNSGANSGAHSGANGSVDVYSIKDPAKPEFKRTLKLDGPVQSVAARNNLIAVAVANPIITKPGKVVFFGRGGETLASFDVGALPDMVTFSPDGNMLLVANEGQAKDGIDPEGSISIIHLKDGLANAEVETLRLNKWDGKEEELRFAGIRIFPGKICSRDFEPEYITVAPDSSVAWVSLQEANAVLEIRLEDRHLELLPCGMVDFNSPQTAIDPSDQDGKTELRPVPVRGMRMPDALACFTIRNAHYIVTANEGDARDEDMRVADLPLDPKAFKSDLSASNQIGRLVVSSLDGDLNKDGMYERLHAYGSRSFSVFHCAPGIGSWSLVFDSQNQFERITLDQNPKHFNADNTVTTTGKTKADMRSDNKGPEPEAACIGRIGNRTYAFIGLERAGGIMMYDVTVPTQTRFITYVNDRHHLGPEDIDFISAEDSPDGKPLLAVAHEISGEVVLYRINAPKDASTLVDEIKSR